jgi:hypothetical protein
MKKITIETIALTANTNLVLRDSIHGVEMELHTPEGQFALPDSDLQRIRAFGQTTFNEEKAGKVTSVLRKSTPAAPASARKPAARPNGDGKEAGTEKPASKQSRRYSDEEKATMLKGFIESPNKSAYARHIDCGIDTLRRWQKEAGK